MAVPSSLSTTHILHRLLRPSPPPPPPSPFLSLIPLPTTSAAALSTVSISRKSVLSKYPKTQLHNTTTTLSSFLYSPSTTTHSLFISHSLSTSSLNHTISLEEEIEEEEEDDDDDGVGEIEYDSGNDTLELEDNSVLVDSVDGSLKEGLNLKRNGSKVPNLTVKEKKELASYAHGLGKKLKCQLVGKSGVTDNVAASFIETLEANELLKIKIHRTCPGELEDVVQQLEEATGSVVVGKIGRTVIVYRPSISKLEAEEKKKLARRIFVRKDSKLKPVSLPRGQVPRLSGRGRRGSSRFQTALFSSTLAGNILMQPIETWPLLEKCLAR